jgi:hypothetical protein
MIFTRPLAGRRECLVQQRVRQRVPQRNGELLARWRILVSP